jgi:hypothetical protein
VKKDKNAGRRTHRLVWGRVLVHGRCRWRAHLITLLYDLHGTVAAGGSEVGCRAEGSGRDGGGSSQKKKKNHTQITAGTAWQGLAALLLGGMLEETTDPSPLHHPHIIATAQCTCMTDSAQGSLDQPAAHVPPRNAQATSLPNKPNGAKKMQRIWGWIMDRSRGLRKTRNASAAPPMHTRAPSAAPCGGGLI